MYGSQQTVTVGIISSLCLPVSNSLGLIYLLT